MNGKFMVHQSESERYILKFISGKYQGGEFALEMNQELIIGRSSELEMVLIEDMVSRHHAKIVTTPEEITIEDLGSTNGTFVNGEKITKCKLKEGDRILIGTSIIKLVYEEQDANQPPPPPSVSLPDMDAPPTMTLTGARRVHSQARSHQAGSGVLTGDINQVHLPDLLQLFGPSKKTGALFVTTPAGTEGGIYMRDGRVYGAVINGNFDVSVMKSFCRIMCWEKGTFLFDTTATYDFEHPINETVETMLMEAMRVMDETRAIGDDVPAFEAIFRITLPLEPKLSDLTKDQLDIFQLALAEPSMEAILNSSELDDIETTKAVVHLLRNNYMVTV